jgi:hypothetical protein
LIRDIVVLEVEQLETRNMSCEIILGAWMIEELDEDGHTVLGE